MQHKFSSSGWVLDKSSIFAQVDAFVQRCKDLLEVKQFSGFMQDLKVQLRNTGVPSQLQA